MPMRNRGATSAMVIITVIDADGLQGTEVVSLTPGQIKDLKEVRGYGPSNIMVWAKACVEMDLEAVDQVTANVADPE